MEQSKYLPLYLKHRPQALGELVGQSSVVKTLTNAIENKRIAHAYLFTGPRGTGKTSSARILAKSLNCEHGPTPTPCLTCVSCVEVKESSSPSVFEIDAASNNSVDDARMIIERAPLVAQGGKFKLYIVDECHMLTKEAFNALLKTIEEPPPGVIFILATTEEHKVPPTILSRCQRLMFRLVNLEELSAHLKEVAKKENIEIEQDALDLITRRSGGGLRDALGLLDQASLLARPGEPVSQKDLLVLLGALDEDVLLTISKGILERSGQAVLDAITGLVMQGREPALIAQELAKHFLNLTKASYVNQGGGGETGRFVLGSTQYLEGLIEQAKLFERVELTQMVETLDALEQSLKRSTQPSMSLEIALLSICHRHEIASVRQLESRIVQLEEMIAEGGASLGTRQQAPQARPAAGGYPQGGDALPHHRPAGGGEVLPHHKQASSAPSSEVLPHRQAQSSEVLPHHKPATAQPSAPQASAQPQPTAPPVVPLALPVQPSPQVQSEPVQSNPSGAEVQSAPVQNTGNVQTNNVVEPAPQTVSENSESFENSDSEEDDDAPDVVVSSVQTLPALPPAPALIRGDDSDEEEEEYVHSDSSGADDAEISDIPYSQNPPTALQSAPEPAVQPPPQAAPAPAAPPPAAPSHEPVGDGELSPAQLERLWSDLLDALHKRSIPAYSLVSMHAFPLRFEAKTLTLGVNREFFQKSIENKTNNIVVAYKDLCNEEIRVIVKVVADAPSPQGDASAKKSSSSGDSGMATSPAVPQPRAEHRPEPAVNHASTGETEASRVPPATATMARPEPRPAPAREQETQRANRPLPHTPPSETHGEVTTSILGDSIDAGKLKEAYKIFEGPGSRLIMP